MLPGHGAALWSIRSPRGWVVERVAITAGEGATFRAHEVSPPHADPIQLVAAAPGGAHVVGCRGADVVVVDATGRGAPRVLASAPDNPSCTVRAATSRHVVFERKVGDAWRVELLPIAGGAAIPIAEGAAWVGLAREEVIVQRGWEGSATIVRASGGGEPVALVPWQAEGITQAKRTPDGRTVVFVTNGVPGWRAVAVDRPGAIVDVTGDIAGVIAIGLTDERLIGWDPGRTRYQSWRVDGSDAGRPTVVIEEVHSPAPFAQDLGRVIAGRADGSVVSALVDGSERVRPVVVLPAGGASWPHGMLAYDAVHRRVVAVRADQGMTVVVSADVLGRDVERPRTLGVVRPTLHTDLHGIEVVDGGDVWLAYATSTTAVPHPAGGELLAADGTGPRHDPAPLRHRTESMRALGLDATPTPDDAFGSETRTPL